MFNKVELKDWESQVRKQLKNDDIYGILAKENLEGVLVKPYYSNTANNIPVLPKVVESTHLVSNYRKELESDVYAFLLEKNVEDISEKTLFINNRELAEHISPKDDNGYIALVDIIDDEAAMLDEQLGRELLAKQFHRNLCVDITLHQNAGAGMAQQLGIALSKAKELVEVFRC